MFEDLAEVQVSTSSFSAQYGIGGVVINQISKSGTNQFHGAGYEYAQNDFFNARNFFADSVPRLRYHNFGGAVGGPIIKNKLFFFFNVDKVINNTATFFSNTYPTADQRAGNFSNAALYPTIYDPASPVTIGADGQPTRTAFQGNIIPQNRLDPVALRIQNLYPMPNRAGYTNNWVGFLPSSSPFLRYFGRADYNITDTNRLTLSVTQRDNPNTYPDPAAPISTFIGDVDSYNGQVSDVWTINSNTVNEFRYGFTRQGNYFSPLTTGLNIPQNLGINYSKANVAPGVNINGSCCSGLGPGTAAQYVENSFEPSDVVTLIRGKHIMHFGGEVLIYQDNSTPWGNVNSGNFTFSGVFTQQAPRVGNGGLGYADFLLGQVDNWNATNTPIVGLRQKSPQFFFQDDYKILPNLTLNLGIRYQIQGGWSEVANRIGTFDPAIINPVTNTPGAIWFPGARGRDKLQQTDYKVILPRLGFSWSPANTWVIRGGAGIYSYGWSVDTYAGGAEGFGTDSRGSLTQTNNATPVFLLSNPNPPLNYGSIGQSPGGYNGQSVSFYPYKTPVARNYQWSLSIQKQLAGGLVAQAAYVASHGTGLSFPVDINQVPGNLLGATVANGDAQPFRRYTQFQGINGNFYNGISNYHSAQVSINKRFSQGLSFDLNYTWSKFLSTQDSAGWGSHDGGQVYQSAYNRQANYGPSNFDIPQMFKGSVVYQLPFGKGKMFMNQNRIFDAVLGGWQASTLFTLESGRPYTVTVGGQNNSGAAAGNWYPNIIGDPSVANPSVSQWFNPLAYAIPTAGTFGNSGRNTLRGPGIEDVDFSLGKNFAVPLPKESGNLQLRFDALNVFNHANFGIPNAQIGNANAGVITATTNNYNSTNNAFGPRTLQLGVRLSF